MGDLLKFTPRQSVDHRAPAYSGGRACREPEEAEDCAQRHVLQTLETHWAQSHAPGTRPWALRWTEDRAHPHFLLT